MRNEGIHFEHPRFLYTFIAFALSAPMIAEATAITTFRILSQIDFFILFNF